MIRSDTNHSVQPQKLASGLKFWIEQGEGLCYVCKENKGTDQLRGYMAADLRLCFPIYLSRFSNKAAHISFFC